jgi:hypothetical protein
VGKEARKASCVREGRCAGLLRKGGREWREGESIVRREGRSAPLRGRSAPLRGCDKVEGVRVDKQIGSELWALVGLQYFWRRAL